MRFIGAGAIAVAAIYTLARLAKPVVGGLVSTLASSRATEREDDRDRDLSGTWIIARRLPVSIAGWLAFTFARSTVLAPSAITLTLIAVPFVLIGGFLIAGICGYMAGLIGASNSPISGVGILSIVLCASVLILAVAPTAATQPALVAFALFITAIVFACATISNDNLQDLKTGQLVGASPMRQQIALIVGVIAGASVIPFVLNLLAKAYGFAGAANVNVVAAKSIAGATGDANLGARARRDRRQSRMENDRHRRAGRRWSHSARHSARRGEETAHTATRSRHRYLPADVGNVRCSRNRLLSFGTAGAQSRSPKSGSCGTTRDARSVGIDRRRESLGRAQRWPHRRQFKRRADRACG